jgi:hypothetical protein
MAHLHVLMGEKEKIIRYIINQQEHHKKESISEEYERICRENGIVPEVPQPYEQIFNPPGCGDGGGIMLSQNRYASLGVIYIQTCGL